MPAHQQPWGRLVLLRHGQTVWSESGQYTGRTDIPLTQIGQEQASEAGKKLQAMFPNGFAPEDVYASSRIRAQKTAELAGFERYHVTDHIVEWDYGRAEGRTRQQIAEATGAPWDVWRDGPQAIHESLGGTRTEHLPDGQSIVVVNGPGETVDEAAARTRQIIEEVRPRLEAGHDVLLVAHAHILRILTTQWLEVTPLFARNLRLDTAHICVLGMYKGDPVIEQWNV